MQGILCMEMDSGEWHSAMYNVGLCVFTHPVNSPKLDLICRRFAEEW